MTVVSKAGTEAVEPIAVPVAAVAAAYQWALAHARHRCRGNAEAEDELIDAATNAVMWSIAHCNDGATFPQQCKAAVRLWVSRQIGRIVRKRKNRPTGVPLVDGLTCREAKPVRPILIEELPADIGFIVRLYFVDGYAVRDIGLLVGLGHNTVARKLHLAAEMIAAGRMAPERAKGQKVMGR